MSLTCCFNYADPTLIAELQDRKKKKKMMMMMVMVKKKEKKKNDGEMYLDSTVK